MLKKLKADEVKDIKTKAGKLTKNVKVSERMLTPLTSIDRNDLPASGKFGSVRFVENKQNETFNHYVIDAIDEKGETVGQISLSTLLGFGLEKDMPIIFAKARTREVPVLKNVKPVNSSLMELGGNNNLSPVELACYLEGQPFEAKKVERITYFPQEEDTVEELNSLDEFQKLAKVNVKTFFEVTLK